MSSELRDRLERAGLPFAGALPEDPILAGVRLDEIRTALSAEQLYGDSLLTDVEFDDVVVGSQRLEELLEILGERPGGRPLVVTSADRLDIVLGLLAAQLSVRGPSVAGVTVDTIFAGLGQSGLYKGALLPVLSTELPLREALVAMGHLDGSVLPSSTQKIARCKVQKVTEAVKLVKARRPDIKVEGPIQYDAAIDPAVAAVKVKGGSEVAGKATVFVFPDLNTGNNTYKAVQQSTGAIAMGPVMQVGCRGGLRRVPGAQ
ncbi:hypothetical protein GPECTOR_142g705 [Gonium pectorale]|uniref:Phosphate acetyl/butaryl transferase domain-containing protein n=1 Tax=Gonium pectorale TaxID=33097 RepID=A0A150FXY4_GONPE|nr:hypothetical protein GPECTOR_142g705 [Gonium pectorale]|eukprot:KXZ42484.1 hypothetical protein GPECTOR_142g705 [Gonium pectorale]